MASERVREAKSVLGMDTGLPLVQLVGDWGDVMIPVEDARAYAMSLLEAAEAAISDHAVFALLTEEIHLPVNEAAGLIRQLRRYRKPDAAGGVK